MLESIGGIAMSVSICTNPTNNPRSKKAFIYLRDIAAIKGNSHIIINALSHHIA